jgi:hypothetical protein
MSAFDKPCQLIKPEERASRSRAPTAGSSPMFILRMSKGAAMPRALATRERSRPGRQLPATELLVTLGRIIVGRGVTADAVSTPSAARASPPVPKRPSEARLV